jgi:hypothetical protein
MAAAGFGVAAIVTAALAPLINKPYGNTLGTAVLSALTSLGFLRATRMRVEFGAAGVAVHGYFTTSHVRWDDFESASADYGGLRIKRRDGAQVTAVCLGKPNWATWLHCSSDADEAVATLNRASTQRQTDTP